MSSTPLQCNLSPGQKRIQHHRAEKPMIPTRSVLLLRISSSFGQGPHSVAYASAGSTNPSIYCALVFWLQKLLCHLETAQGRCLGDPLVTSAIIASSVGLHQLHLLYQHRDDEDHSVQIGQPISFFHPIPSAPLEPAGYRSMTGPHQVQNHPRDPGHTGGQDVHWPVVHASPSKASQQIHHLKKLQPLPKTAREKAAHGAPSLSLKANATTLGGTSVDPTASRARASSDCIVPGSPGVG